MRKLKLQMQMSTELKLAASTAYPSGVVVNTYARPA